MDWLVPSLPVVVPYRKTNRRVNVPMPVVNDQCQFNSTSEYGELPMALKLTLFLIRPSSIEKGDAIAAMGILTSSRTQDKGNYKY